jgi:hypothetical protein
LWRNRKQLTGVDELRKHKFVSDKFKPVQPNWNNFYRNRFVDMTTVDRLKMEKDGLKSRDELYQGISNIDINKLCEEYKRIFLHNIEEFIKIV